MNEKLIEKYRNELKATVEGMDNIRKEIAKLNQTGVELTAQANVLAGKIEALEEIAKIDGDENV